MIQRLYLHKASILGGLAIGGMALALLLFHLLGSSGGTPPNILFILIDDMGYNDLGANGNPGVSAPHLDALAAEEVRFTRNYVDSTCSSTRAGILTGTTPAARGFRPRGLGISPVIVTLPEALRAAGYSTHHIGKWHVGYASKLSWPTAQGFDHFFGFLNQFLLRGPHVEGQFKLARPTYRNPWLQEQAQWPVRHKGHLAETRPVNIRDSKYACLSGIPWRSLARITVST